MNKTYNIGKKMGALEESHKNTMDKLKVLKLDNQMKEHKFSR